MTTIAIKDGIMCCDSQLTASGTRVLHTKFNKVIKHDDVLYGFAGDCHHIAVVKAFITGDGGIDSVPESVDMTVVCLPKKGKPYEMTFRDGILTTMDITSPYYAIGSGCEFAMVAMHCGKSAKQAVEIAKHFDIYTGGAVKSFSFKNTKG